MNIKTNETCCLKSKEIVILKILFPCGIEAGGGVGSGGYLQVLRFPIRKQ